MTTRARALAQVATFSLLYFACAVAALFVTGGEDGIAAIWPASGVYIAALLLTGPTLRGPLVAGVAATSLAANLWGGVGWLVAVGYTVANILEGLVVWRVMGARRATPFLTPATLLRFLVAILVGAIASTAMAALLSLNPSPTFLSSWATTVLLGMATVTPTIMFLVQDRRGRRRLTSPRAFAVLALVAGLSVAAFAQTDYPLLFLPMAGLAFATFAIGVSGTALGIVIVTAVGSLYTAMGEGPVSSAFASITSQVLYFQAYLVCLIASTLPLAVLLTRLGEEAERNLELAETDALTGLATRRKILARLDQAMQRAREEAGALSIAMIDLDHFKRINDRFGHERGDEILRTITAMMRDRLGAHGEIGRLGGEEFIVIFEGVWAHERLEVCDRLRRAAAERQWPADGPDTVTLSIGLADFSDRYTLPGEMLRAADTALYRAKDGGRNRCAIDATRAPASPDPRPRPRLASG
ncbi:GGDEF domain-containing protein [Sphingomicrobium astaxanthinifaciens]|uniref:GGDEF domain-containing protein n=1 Tax=Sphingomicrobium astaxanthinifaciens TaxID=1227949 RepID=UPI001FCC2937|nr:diguanylate cyclase [Sphingomicrobium astaxanthinifaciens]MCJ7422373.1 diguanylate cyclase [Sphingomicrobium astaxanthinifaciens]